VNDETWNIHFGKEKTCMYSQVRVLVSLVLFLSTENSHYKTSQ